MLTLYIDFKSPASYLALAPTLRLIDELDVDVRVQPFITRERERPTQLDNASVGDSHRRVRAQSRRTTHERYARSQGLEMHWPEPMGQTELALGALALLDGSPWEYIRAAFHAFWVDNEDLDSPDSVARLLAMAGENLTVDTPARFIAALSTEQQAAEARGVVDAPAYWIDEQLFIGREHLPWIRELLRR